MVLIIISANDFTILTFHINSCSAGNLFLHLRPIKFMHDYVKRFIAGASIYDALAYAKKINADGKKALLNILGEHTIDTNRARRTAVNYLILMNQIKKEKLNADISVKLTQLGLSVDREFCLECMEKILSRAARQNIFIWIDMESSDFTQSTLDIYLKLLKTYKNLAVSLQSCLWRTEADMIKILEKGGIVRLVKGAYRESEKIAFDNKGTANNFRLLMELLFERGNNFAIATHDEKLLKNAMNVSKFYKKKLEFQFLMGLEPQIEIDKKYAVSQYVPFGKKWQNYINRRLNDL